MTTEIYYFSGTGNALYIARELQKRLPDSGLVPIVRMLKSAKIKTHADVIGIVFPIYATSYPEEIKKFIELLEFDKDTYVFAVTSRKCRPRVFSEIAGLLQRRGGKLSASLSAAMPQNYIPVFNVESEETIRKMDAELQEALDTFAGAVAEKRVCLEAAQKLPIKYALPYALVRFFSFLNKKTRYFNLENRFYTDENCTGCGLCQRVCLAERIGMDNKQPKWDTGIPCRLCLACVHYCPAGAIQIKGTKTAKTGRYHHTGVTAEDIAGQK